MRTLALAVVLLLAAAVPAADARPRAAAPLKQFDSCRALVSYAKRQPPRPPVVVAPRTGEIERGDMSFDSQIEAATGDDFSGTNVQEAGVDEADGVKTDGKTLFVLAQGALQTIDARAPEPKLLATLELAGDPDSILLAGDRLLALGTGPRGTRLSEIDVSDRARPRLLRTEDVDGSVLDARLTGATARVVIGARPFGLEGPQTRSRARAWLPKRRLRDLTTGESERRGVGCRSVRRPAVPAGAGTVTVYTVDLRRGLPAVDVDSLLADSAAIVYASPTALYLATSRGQRAERTSIHRFDTSVGQRTFYAGSGMVEGRLIGQFALSEYEGILRVASTTGFGSEAESRVTTLALDGARLAQRGLVAGLGKTERIYAVRFIGAVGYVVTFRETDPLYSIDLSDPAAPRLRGELKIPGYSAYLHPVGDDLLLGIGQDASDRGQVQGLALSLFDISDLDRPRRIAQYGLGGEGSNSTVEYDHKGFLWWPQRNLAVLPTSNQNANPPQAGAAAIKIDRATGFALLAKLRQRGTPDRPKKESFSWTDSDTAIERTVIVGERLLTVSGTGVGVWTLEGFRDAGWVPFPLAKDPGTPMSQRGWR